MSRFRDDDQLITKLLNETYDVLPSQNISKNSQDLSDYFNQKVTIAEFNSLIKEIEKFSEKSQTYAASLEYVLSTGCYQATFKNSKIDFPSNWSIFEQLHNSNQNCVIEERDSVLGTFFIQDSQDPVIFLVKASSKSYLIAVDSNREFEYRWIKNKISTLNSFQIEQENNEDLAS